MIPLLAVAAVALCVALVIVVISVMTGFLDMVRNSGRTLMGDVVVDYPLHGIPDYERLIALMTAKPEIDAATPVVDTWGLLRMPYPAGDAKESTQVQIWGIDPVSFSQVTGFDESLQWEAVPPGTASGMRTQAIDRHAEELILALDQESKRRLLTMTDDGALEGADTQVIDKLIDGQQFQDWRARLQSLSSTPELLREAIGEERWAVLHSDLPRLLDDRLVLEEGRTLLRNGEPAMVSGLHVSRGNRRTRQGTYKIEGNGYWWMPRFDAILTTIPITSRGGLNDEPQSIRLPFANEFASGVFLIDKTRVMVPLESAQKLTELQSRKGRLNGEIVERPARATKILVRASEGVTPYELKVVVRDTYAEFEQTHSPDAHWAPPAMRSGSGPEVRTWEEQNADFIGPVEKERELMRTLFSIIYLVCGALIVAIFWAIVYEKTRDIGILRSVGASRSGIVMIFLLYGLFVGVLGALAGIGLGWLVTSNMETIHESLSMPPMWLGVALLILAAIFAIMTFRASRTGRLLPVLLGSLGTLTVGGLGIAELLVRQAGGIVLWDPSVYYFTEVPNTVDWPSALITAGGAVLCSVLAAAIPAAKAADIDPIGALRYE